MIEQTIEIKDVEPVLVFGIQDRILKKIETAYPGATLSARGNKIKISGSSEDFAEINDLVNRLIRLAIRNKAVTDQDVNTLLNMKLGERLADDNATAPADGETIVRTHTGEVVRAKTPNQKRIVEASAKNDIVFAIGPAGTGKTYTSVAIAVKALKEKKVKKIVLVRPAVEAGENLGFLPGGLKDKIDPYLRPLYDALEEMIDKDRLDLNMTKNVIEIAPLAYMRGRTLNNAFVILDEAQNATNMQMKMFLTRLGFNSRAIITGDITQTDLPRLKQSGLISIQQILKNIDGIEFVYLDQRDVVRHKLIREIISAYERHEQKEEARLEKAEQERIAAAKQREQGKPGS
ncbi:MAG: PhoH family protein [Candidatus Cyclonatronum sp.]|uniref:PhoH family protein n=1 Tax=Cyclonatronum sp. TaxID=3024185 RepID=UPI0025B95F48|nr:PhoH family protein [Cyclonatronum sp.]MCH8486302.1 PhoH family protein [Cyclonatronum sp.]